MKTMSKTQAMFRIILVLWIFTLVVSCAPEQVESEIAPPAPEDPVTELKPAIQIPDTEISAQASIQRDVQFGFALDLNERLVLKDWQIEGTAIQVEKEVIQYRTNDGMVGRFAYRLPEGQQIALRPDQPIVISRSIENLGASLDYHLYVTSKDTTILASGRSSGGIAQKIVVDKGISLYQVEERRLQSIEGKYETTFILPVILQYGRQEISVTPGEYVEFIYGDGVWKLIVTTSFHVIPNKGYEGLLEGQPYILEYVVIQE